MTKPRVRFLGMRRNPTTGKDEPTYEYIYDDLAAAEAHDRDHPMVGPPPVDNRNTPGPAGTVLKKEKPKQAATIPSGYTRTGKA